MSLLNDRELARAHDALGNLYRALAALRVRYAESNPRAFELLAEGPLQEIRRIRHEIEEYTGFALAEDLEARLWLRLEGPRAKWRETPASVLTAFLDALRKGVQAVAGFIVAGKVTARPSLALQEACNFELVAFRPGSFGVGLRLPSGYQLEMFETEAVAAARRALDDFLLAARWASSKGTPDELLSLFPEAPRQRTILRALKPFVPRQNGGIDRVVLYGSDVPGEPVQLTQDAAVSIRKAFEAAVSEHEIQYVGEIREMDLDKKSFKLRQVPDVGEVPCRFGEDFLPIAQGLLGKRVRVIGIRSAGPTSAKAPLQLVDLERLQDDAPPSGGL